MDQTTMLSMIEASYAEFEAALAQIDEAALTTPGVEGDWSVKDVLAHLSYWQLRLRLQIEAALRGERPASPLTALDADLPRDETWMDQLNARVVTAQLDQTAAEALAEFRRSHQQTLAALRHIPEHALAEPAALEALLGTSLGELIAGDTWEHYQEHTPTLRAWSARQPGG